MEDSEVKLKIYLQIYTWQTHGDYIIDTFRTKEYVKSQLLCITFNWSHDLLPWYFQNILRECSWWKYMAYREQTGKKKIPYFEYVKL